LKTIICGDTHIKESAIPELKNTFETDIFPIQADRFVQVGDWFESNRPTPREQMFSSWLINKLKELYKEVIILSGNGTHDLLNDASAIEHLSYISGKIKTVKGDYIDGEVLYGHWMTDCSKFEYGTHRHTVKDLKDKYKYVFLGHQHSPQKLADNIFHVGSIRYVGWNEAQDLNKSIMIIDGDKIETIKLTSPIQMIDVYDLKELDDISPDTKIRLVLKDFNQFKNSINELSKYKNRFEEFKLKLDFEIKKPDQVATSKQRQTRDNIIREYIDNIEDKEVKQVLEEQFKESD